MWWWFLWISVVVYWIVRRRYEEHMRLDEYGCLLKHIEEKLGSNVIHVLSIDERHVHVIAFNKGRHTMRTYRVTYDASSFKPTDVYMLGNKVMTDEERRLYLKA